MQDCADGWSGATVIVTVAVGTSMVSVTAGATAVTPATPVAVASGVDASAPPLVLLTT